MALKPILQVKELSFRYETRGIFQQWSTQLGAGITWLKGKNGAGKTTLLKLLGCALHAQSGSVYLDKLCQKTDSLEYRKNSFLCQGELPQLEWLTVKELLDLYLSLYPGIKATQLNIQLNSFGLMEILPNSIATLSLGQHKKIQLAVAFSLPVALLLLDEPLNALDTTALEHLRQELMDRSRLEQQCIVLTSHIDPLVPINRVIEL